ncbi:hypothetical protein [Streptomyces sp. NPDC047928]|uniref:hypothetical protein n=1 Tax=unclassified Streptomyces TaxID=2593676 RepID=UPI0037165F41
MTEHHPPEEVREFAGWLRGLAALIDQDGGWYGVFRQRDPDGLRACLAGAEVPPWDVVEALLQDLAAVPGADPAWADAARARRLHEAAATAHDRRPGGRDALRQRLELMAHEQARAARRAAELVAELGTVPDGSAEAERLAHELAWLRDDHARATARITELGARLAAAQAPWFRQRARADRAPEPPAPAEARPASAEAKPAPAEAREERGRWGRGGARRRPRGARYAWLEEAAGEAGAADPLPELPNAAAPAPRGARFGGAAEPEPAQTPEAAPASAGPAPTADDHAARRSARETVAALLGLRAEGRGGEAHALLCEAALRPASWLPPLAVELERAGLVADWSTLLWEAASLPPARLASVAVELTTAGRESDARGLLRQGVAGPPGDTAAVVLEFDDSGRQAHARSLVEALVRSRTAEDTARFAAHAPDRLVPQVLSAARTVPDAQERAIVHALRVAGLTA